MGVVVEKKYMALTAPRAWQKRFAARRQLSGETERYRPARGRASSVPGTSLHCTSTTRQPTSKNKSGTRISRPMRRRGIPPRAPMARTMEAAMKSPTAQWAAPMLAKITARIKKSFSPGLTTRRGEWAARASSSSMPPGWE